MGCKVSTIAGVIFAAVSFIAPLAYSKDNVSKVENGPAMEITSSEFYHNAYIPGEYTCEGNDINPPLTIEGIPGGAKTLVLIVDDPDAPGKTWVHWVVFDIPVTGSIGKDTVPGRQGVNDFGRLSYGGPCPPQGTHRYFFKAYALDKALGLEEGIDKAALEQAIEGHILAQAELIGLYRRAANREKKL